MDKMTRSMAEAEIETLQRKLEGYEHLYNLSVGVETRIKWRKDMSAVQAEIAKKRRELRKRA
jgi:hypothetical protein